MKIISTITRAVSDPNFYREQISQGIQGGWKYFFSLMALLAVLFTMASITQMWHSFRAFGGSEEVQRRALEWYPRELVVRLERGQVSINAPEPYMIPLPEAGRAGSAMSEQGRLPVHLVVIDTTQPITMDSFRKYDTVVIVSRDAIGFRDQESQKIEIQDLSQFPIERVQIDYHLYTELITLGVRYAKIVVGILAVFFPLILFALLSLQHLLYLLFGALIVLGGARLRQVSLSYGQAYRLGLFLITLPLGYELLVSHFAFPELRVPFLFTVLLGVVTWIHIRPLSISPTQGALPTQLPTEAKEGASPGRPPIEKDELSAA